MISAQLRALRDAITRADERVAVLSFEMPMRLDSVANGSQGMSFGGRKQRSDSTKQRRRMTAMKFKTAIRSRGVMVRLPAVVLVTRIAPRVLDRHDNLGRACKAVIDGIADALGIDDQDPRVTFIPDQEKRGVREHAVRVEVFTA